MAVKLGITIFFGVCISFGLVESQGNLYFPSFYMVSHYPEVGRSSEFYIYAIDKFSFPTTEISITKDGGLPSSAVETGMITKAGESFGCFLKVHDMPYRRGLRYGQYRAQFSNPTFASFLPPFGKNTSYTFVKPKSGLLNTRGVYTVTIYPESTFSNNLKEKVPVGVQWTPGCNKIIWRKGKRRNINVGPRLDLKTTEDAGLYTIQRPGRAKRGFHVQILVTAASCPENYFYNLTDSRCEETSLVCINGGVLSNNYPLCICPLSFFGETCECFKIVDGLDNVEPVLGIEGPPLNCRDLPGGNPTCKGHLTCLGDNYGCTCASGWYGNACDRACPKGKWGVNCQVKCPRHEPDCNRFYGSSSNIDECVI